jgi:hypothetical protein
VLVIEAALIGIAATVAGAPAVHPDSASVDLVIALLTLATGVGNAAVRKMSVPNLRTVRTLALTGLAADSRLAGESEKGSTRRAAASRRVRK